MTDFNGKTYWLVGASEGLGEAVAAKLAKRGAKLVLSARSVDKLQALADRLPGDPRVVPIDVSDSGSVAEAVQTVGEVDGMVFLAGVYWPMSSQQWDAEKAEAMVDVNFTGAVRVLGHVVPQMVAKGSGHIVLTGSLSGFRGLGGTIGYGASKAGVMYLAEGMRADLRATGVKVQLVNPGFVRTRLTDKNDFAMPFIMDPDAAADHFVGHMEKRGFACNFPWLFSLVFRVSRVFPDWLYYRIFAAKS